MDFGPQRQLVIGLGFLMSYEHMGYALVACLEVGRVTCANWTARLWHACLMRPCLLLSQHKLQQALDKLALAAGLRVPAQGIQPAARLPYQHDLLEDAQCGAE